MESIKEFCTGSEALWFELSKDWTYRGPTDFGARPQRARSPVVLAWCGRVRALVAGWAAGLGCCGTVVVVGAAGDGAVGVPRGSGRGVVRCGWTRALVGVSRPAGGR